MSSTEHNHAHGGISNESSPKNKKLEMLRRGNKRRHSFSEHQIKQLVLPKDQKQQTTDSTNSSPGESPVTLQQQQKIQKTLFELFSILMIFLFASFFEQWMPFLV